MAGLYPEIWDAHLCLAEVLKGCGEFDKATVEYHEAARLGATTGFSVDEPAD
jgi:Tfp pilus assembly protein PilF